MVNRGQVIDEGYDRLRYEIRLLIKHPRIDPSSVTMRLGLTPHVANFAGTHRETPVGTQLPGTYNESVWGYIIRITKRRRFFESVVELVDLIEQHSDFLSEIVETGGTIDLIVHLPGDINIGDTVSWRELRRLAILKVSLGIEVFPAFD